MSLSTRYGEDRVQLLLSEVGKPQTQVTLRHQLLDETKNYHVAVTSLSVPFDDVPLTNTTLPAEIFQVIRRNVGIAFTDANVALLGPPANVPHMQADRPYTDVFDLIRTFQSYCQGFNQYMSLLGRTDVALYGAPDGTETATVKTAPPVAPHLVADQTRKFLEVTVSASGHLEIHMSPEFSNNFVLKFHDQYSVDLLGLTSAVLVTQIGQETLHFLAVSTVAGVQTVTNRVMVAGQFIAAVNLRTEVVTSSENIFHLLDHRIKVAVETHLPIKHNLQIVNGKEQINRDIAEIYISAPSTASVVFSQTGLISDTSIRRRIFNGQTQLIRKSDPIRQYSKLLTSSNLQFIRVNLYMIYKIYIASTKTWEFQRVPFSISGNGFWELTLLFCSDS